jgi:hypothetical protein
MWKPIAECPKTPDEPYLVRGKYPKQTHDEISGPAIAEWYENGWSEWLGGQGYGTGLAFDVLEFMTIPK